MVRVAATTPQCPDHTSQDEWSKKNRNNSEVAGVVCSSTAWYARARQARKRALREGSARMRAGAEWQRDDARAAGSKVDRDRYRQRRMRMRRSGEAGRSGETRVPAAKYPSVGARRRQMPGAI